MSHTKTKWQQIMDAPKGSMEYNPTQSFALHVIWIVRSPSAAKEMIQHGFKACSVATKRDTPTTLTYFFRVSRDQRLADQLKSQVKTIGQHPHYQPAFKSIQMGIPQSSIETKLKLGGIDLNPLSWGTEEPIAGHETELDFDPVVLECTEVYLDNRGFYDHSASRDWMKAYPEIMKPSRSLKPATICLGTPSDEIWEKCLDSFLKATKFNDDQRESLRVIQPGLFLHKSASYSENITHCLFVEFGLVIQSEKLKTDVSPHLISSIQKELEAPLMLIFPTSPEEEELLELRLMLSIPFPSSSSELNCTSLKAFTNLCHEVEGRIIVSASESEIAKQDNNLEFVQRSNYQAAEQFLHRSGLEKSSKITILDGNQAEQSNTLAGYALHPLFHQLISNDKLPNYQL
eukprot:TRINITY_DN1410_c0_g3_i1.p1 TRINITY_DN1410_c0_g3~~TRINITY_DN1410_c0_g3_i1.p1  ORF type:complete len:412 (+),score=64.66 TRINITY_DN1410_c0_g3_i1:32-1237(+)